MGRGASKIGDGTGAFGGGMEGNDTSTSVKSSHPLTDEIEKGEAKPKKKTSTTNKTSKKK